MVSAFFVCVCVYPKQRRLMRNKKTQGSQKNIDKNMGNSGMFISHTPQFTSQFYKEKNLDVCVCPVVG